jgi:hypothetical protein
VAARPRGSTVVDIEARARAAEPRPDTVSRAGTSNTFLFTIRALAVPRLAGTERELIVTPVAVPNPGRPGGVGTGSRGGGASPAGAGGVGFGAGGVGFGSGAGSAGGSGSAWAGALPSILTQRATDGTPCSLIRNSMYQPG